MLEAFSRVGYIKKEDIKTHAGLSDRRINNYMRDNYIEKVGYINKDKNSDTCFRLTVKGKELCKNKLSIEYLYKSPSVNHDLKLASTYFSLDSQKQENWITETEWIKQLDNLMEKLEKEDYRRYQEILFKKSNGQISVPDGGYHIEGTNQIVAVEVVTGSYRSSDIQAKIEFCNIVGASYREF